MPSYQIRMARESEFEAIGDLTVAAYASFTQGPGDPYIQRLRDTRTRATQAELWVAVSDGRLLGSVTYTPPGSPWRELSADSDEGEFRMLSVHPDARGLGVGDALVSRCEERSVDDGATSMVLSSLPDMRDAHRLYARRGYQRAPERDWSPVPGTELIAFTKELR